MQENVQETEHLNLVFDYEIKRGPICSLQRDTLPVVIESLLMGVDGFEANKLTRYQSLA